MNTEIVHQSDTPELSEAEQREFFQGVLEGWRVAAERAGRVSVLLDVADTLVELVFAGDCLVPMLTPALRHLEVAPGRAPDVTLHLWDSESTGTAIVPPPRGRSGFTFTERGDIWGMSSRTTRSAFHWHEFSVNVLDVESMTGVFWVNSAASLPYWSKASPLRTLFHWIAEANGAQLLHAAAVGDENGALLITGRGGVGKSSTSLACLADGMQFVADDYLLVKLDPEPRVYSLYSTAKLDGGQLERFPTLRAHVTNQETLDTEKAVLHLLPAFAAQVVRSLPIRAVATPAFADQPDTTFGAAPTTTLQRAAAFTTMSQLPGAGRATHAFIDRMISLLPGLSMQLGYARDRVPAAIRGLLAWSDAELRAMARAEQRDDGLPVVSVIIPVFNGVPFLERCIRNVLSQDYAPMEIIVVDDGSGDDIESAVRALPVDVRFFRQPNGGPASARNRGIREASGEIIAFLDVDDLWPEHNLSHLVRCLLDDPAAAVVHGRAQVTRMTDDDGPGQFIGSPGESYPYYIGAGVYHRRAFDRVGLFDPELRFAEDTDWFQRARDCGLGIRHVDEVALFVRRHEGNMTRGKSHVELNALRLLKKTLDRKRAMQAAQGASPGPAGAA